ncbi:unnamed protein product [Caenorhabditis angaria]|uniref:Uncharacterized protein n=1 Tax=Caenorhabditis angaria TaxID=860376 RepID=A0A9P1J2F6_9PELO|nr:unnamed protein product [Caenorhabditis angaria]
MPEEEPKLAGELEGMPGYRKSWGFLQISVDKIKTQKIIPVQPSQRRRRQRRHLVKRRVDVNMQRDMHIMSLIRNVQKFQLEVEETIEGRPPRVEINAEPPERKIKRRRDKHYDYYPVFEPLAPWTYLIDAAEECTVTDDEDGECDLSTPLMFAVECKEDGEFLPAPLSDEIGDKLSALYQSPISVAPKENFITKFLKRHGITV